MKNLLLFLSLLVVLAPSPIRAEETVATILGDRPATAILRTMPSDTPANQRLAALRFIAGYEVIGADVSLPPAAAVAIATALKSPTAFDAEKVEEKMRPGVSYRFGSGPDAVEVLVCFGCDKIAVIPPGADAISETHHITQATRDVLLTTAKELLPQDEAIQELPKVRRSRPVPPPFAPVPKDAPKPGQSVGG